MNFLITGAAGFIGSHLAELLISKGHTVVGVDNFLSGRADNLAKVQESRRFKLLEVDITKLNVSQIPHETEYIIHLAGKGEIVPSIEAPEDYITNNVLGTVNVLNVAKTLNVKKFIYAASSSCYGIAETPTSEKEPINAEHPYALSKFLGEMCVLHWHKVYGLPANSIRIFNAYGPRCGITKNYGAAIGVFMAQKLAGLPLTIVGDGNQERDFIYVTDVAEAFYLAAISKFTGQIWNLGSGKPIKVNYLASLINDKVTYIPHRPGEPNTTHADISKIRKDLDFEPRVQIEEGIKKILINIKDYESQTIWTPSSIEKATINWFKNLGENRINE
jgi:UDP-glucose 4-epimerase